MKNVLKQKILWQPMLEISSGASAPDSFDGPSGSVPPDDFVVARDRKGNPVSYYGDHCWDYTAYHPRGRTCRLWFRPWGQNAMNRKQMLLVREMLSVMFILIWKRSGTPLAVTTLQKFLSALNSIARFANDNCYRISDIFSNLHVMRQLLEKPDPVVLMTLPGMLITLIELGESEIGFQPLGGATLAEIATAQRKYTAVLKQHPPLPPRIYSELIKNTMRELTEIESFIDRYLRVVKVLCQWQGDNPSKIKISRDGNTYNKRNGESSALREMLEQNGLVEYFNRMDLDFAREGLLRGLSDIYETCQYGIHIFSGARKEEVCYLPYHCIEKRRNAGHIDYLLHGYTTKFNNGRLKKTYWVTSKEGAYAVGLAQKVADAIYQHIGGTPNKSGRTDKYPLFVSTAYLPFASKIMPKVTDDRHAAGSNRITRHSEVLLSRLLPIIEEQDLHELKQIDPHRAWFSEPKFKPGNLWPLKRHQLRRSLALYASSSGLVSLPSLRRQLQHITEAMSRYYARGSQLARNIIGGVKDHFGIEYQEAQSESQALAYIASVLFSDEHLFGAHGIFYERHLKRKGEVAILEDREKTIKLFKKGAIAWQATMLGGCTETAPCEKKALRSMIGCLDCKKAVLKLSKVRRVVAAQEALVIDLNPSSVEYRSEKHDLEILLAAQARMEEQPMSKERKHA